MVIDDIHLEGITVFEPENQPPVSGDGHAPKTLQLTPQRMQTPAGKQRDVGGRSALSMAAIMSAIFSA
jgi:hypothetical protein